MAKKKDRYTSVPVPGFPGLTDVRLYDSTLEHIREEHSEFRLLLPSHVEGIKEGLSKPTAIHDSGTQAKSFVFVSNKFTNQDNDIHIAVRHVEGTSGRVQTAYFSSGPPTGTLLWKAKDAK